MCLTFLGSEMTGFSQVCMKITFHLFNGFINATKQETPEDIRCGLLCEYFVSGSFSVITQRSMGGAVTSMEMGNVNKTLVGRPQHKDAAFET
jgi:hypothetical protein